jgi:hypothetical protein
VFHLPLALLKPSLSTPRKILIFSSAIKVLSVRTNQCFDIIFKPKLLHIFNQRTVATMSIKEFVIDVLTDSGFNLKKMYPTEYTSSPPWLVQLSDIVTRLTEPRKAINPEPCWYGTQAFLLSDQHTLGSSDMLLFWWLNFILTFLWAVPAGEDGAEDVHFILP